MERLMAEANNAITRATHVSPIERVAHSVAGLREITDPVPVDEVTISFFEYEMPEFVEPELDRLYQSIYSTVARLRIYGRYKDINAFVARRGEKIISVILFQLEDCKVVVLNEQTNINAVEISRFSSEVFFRYKSVTLISFWGLMPTQGRIPFLSHRNYCLSDVVVTLPESTETYLSSLGKSTRRHIRSNLKKVATKFSSFRVETNIKTEIHASEIFDIIKLSNARMKVKEKLSYNSDEETQRLIRLANAYGLVLTLRIDDRICAGAVCYRVGSTYFAQVLAHDPKFDEYKLGVVCCYLMICECIARGGREVRFGGSTHRYKFDFQGFLLRLDYLIVYRNVGHYILHAANALSMSFEAYIRRAKLWLLLAERRDDYISRVIARIIQRVREFKISENVQ
jgi:hypothetical protein